MNTKTPQKPDEKAQPTLSPSKRFEALVIREFEQNVGELKVTEHMTRLIQSYFVKLDSILKENETKRLQKSGNFQDPLQFTWENVNMTKMAQDVIPFAMVGLDPMQPNQIFLIPYKNSHTNKFDIGFVPGYKGIEIKAKKYGLDVPKHVRIELVYSNDDFQIVKKDFQNEIEHYKLEVKNAFDRGTIIGGFYYFEYEDKTQNFIRPLSITDIEKRKPKYASPEFWGGEKDEFVGGKKTGKKTTVEGWHAEMCYKTIYRAAYGSITIDSSKINQHYMDALRLENEYIQNNTIDVDYKDVTTKTENKKEALREKKAIASLEEAKEMETIPETPIQQEAPLSAINDLMNEGNTEFDELP